MFNFDKAKANVVRTIAASAGNKGRTIEVLIEGYYN